MPIRVRYSNGLSSPSEWSESRREYFRRKIEVAASPGGKSVNIYNGKGRGSRFTQDRSALDIFVDASPLRSQEWTAEDKAKALETDSLLPRIEMRTFTDVYKDGVVFAQYDQTHNDLYILIKLFDLSEVKFTQYTWLITEFIKNIEAEREKKSSWINGDQNQLVALLEEGMKEVSARAKRNYTRDIAQANDNISHAKDMMTNAYRQIKKAQEMLLALELNSNAGLEKLKKELNLVAELDKVEDIVITEGNQVRIKTKELFAYNQAGHRFRMGKYTIRIKLGTSDVRFQGDNPRRSYWTPEDPHPHVNGDSGEACLGNVAPTIAQLSNQEELYALTTVCISFLESANESDPAGANIVHWDRVDEEGKVIREGREGNSTECDCCGNDFEAEDLYPVYQGFDENNNLDDGHHVCEECRDDHYYYDGSADEYVANGAERRPEADCANCGASIIEDHMVAGYREYDGNGEPDREESVCTNCFAMYYDSNRVHEDAEQPVQEEVEDQLVPEDVQEVAPTESIRATFDEFLTQIGDQSPPRVRRFTSEIEHHPNEQAQQEEALQALMNNEITLEEYNALYTGEEEQDE